VGGHQRALSEEHDRGGEGDADHGLRAFVELQPGIEGWCTSRRCRNSGSSRLATWWRRARKCRLRVVGIDMEARRISLSLKRARPAEPAAPAGGAAAKKTEPRSARGRCAGPDFALGVVRSLGFTDPGSGFGVRFMSRLAQRRVGSCSGPLLSCGCSDGVPVFPGARRSTSTWSRRADVPSAQRRRIHC